MPDAWLFDAYPHPRVSKIVLWIKHGDKMLRRLEPYHPEFCVAADGGRLDKAEKVLAGDPRVVSVRRGMRRLWLRGPEQEVLLVRTRRLQDIHAAATAFRRATRCRDFLLFDVDHAPESRFLHERGLSFMCRLHVGTGPELRLAAGEDRWMYDYPDPPLGVGKLAVEVDQQGPEKRLDDPLVEVRLGDEEFRAHGPGGERGALLSFARRLARLDPDVFLTRHGDRFDVPYLLSRIRAHGLDVRLGRGPDPTRPAQEGKSMHTYGRWLFKTAAHYLRGRWHIDLSKKALDSEDDRRDLYGIVYVSRIANRRPQDVNRNGAGYALQQMQVDAAVDMGVALPWKRNLAEDWKDAATLCAVDRGGQIMVPTPGIVEDVVACDFSGYYPSIVVAHNLSSDTINCACCPDGPLVPELGYHVCQKVVGHQAGVLRRLVEHRRLVKAILKQSAHAAVPVAGASAPARPVDSHAPSAHTRVTPA